MSNQENNAFAIIESNGKQFVVSPGDYIDLDNLNLESGSEIIFDKVLYKKEDSDSPATIGTPYISGASVKAEVNKNFKGEKIVVFHKRRRKGSKSRQGHRQSLTRVLINNI